MIVDKLRIYHVCIFNMDNFLKIGSVCALCILHLYFIYIWEENKICNYDIIPEQHFNRS